jgi:two-component system, NtrC family, response regulator HydG
MQDHRPIDATVHVEGFDALGVDLDLRFADGKILLNGMRMVLLHAATLGLLRRDLIHTLGFDRARALLYRVGHASGSRDAEMVGNLLPKDASDDEKLRAGPLLHMLEGVVKVQAERVTWDMAAGTMDGEFLWLDSHEAAEHVAMFGVHHSPVCWMQSGYASGYISKLLGGLMLVHETACIGRGDAHCRIHCRDAGRATAAEVEAARRLLEPDPVAEQLIDLQAQVSDLRAALGEPGPSTEMVGASPAFHRTLSLLRKAADSTVTVLLLGETGVGKERFARLLHDTGRRRDAPFVALNCAAIPESLIESELFGVEKGAYTGAQQTRAGKFERANGGTLFLDEVGELTLPAQSKLLRVLQEGEFERLGDTRSRSADVRIVAATNQDLRRKVAEGSFRSDLFYRLNIFPVTVPPLRERADDVPLLVEHFLHLFAARHGRRRVVVCPRALSALQGHDWPGNVRELANVIERGVIVAGDDGMIGVDDLFPFLDGVPPVAEDGVVSMQVDAPTGDAGGTAMADAILDTGRPLEELEQDLLNAAVRRAGGNLAQAARALGITRAQLAYRLRRQGTPSDRVNASP